MAVTHNRSHLVTRVTFLSTAKRCGSADLPTSIAHDPLETLCKHSGHIQGIITFHPVQAVGLLAQAPSAVGGEEGAVSLHQVLWTQTSHPLQGVNVLKDREAKDRTGQSSMRRETLKVSDPVQNRQNIIKTIIIKGKDCFTHLCVAT